MDILIVIAVLGVLGFLSYIYSLGERAKAQQSPEDRLDQELAAQWGPRKPQIICSQCQTRGHVRTMAVTRKKGISGAKATGALLTGGVSLLATGLSRKDDETQAHCTNCESTWYF